MELLRETLFSPSTAAEKILSMRFRPDALWMALILMGVLNALIQGISLYISPIPDGVVVPSLFLSPLLFATASVLSLVATVCLLHWLGQTLGGEAQRNDLLVLVTWLQVVRILAQLFSALVVFIMPAMAGLLMLVASLWGIVILVTFINKAHRFSNPFKGLGVLIGTMLGMVLGLSLLFSAIGASIVGVA
ncbi:Yip1 family protein [Roseovarius sp. EL26]|uniref:Yip1 family protein n=1 Tax=Roseovarius sp. EL26 TaxID=2126672 RepID=UPI0013C4A67B|nr:Yip1 family protein [Roseovarius sp. EL26]